MTPAETLGRAASYMGGCDDDLTPPVVAVIRATEHLAEEAGQPCVWWTVFRDSLIESGEVNGGSFFQHSGVLRIRRA